MYLTYRYRIKGSASHTFLNQCARAVNFVWNFCNETAYKALRNESRWLNEKDLESLTKGSSKDLNFNSQSIQEVVWEFCQKRCQSKKRKLRWRTKKSLGWVPVTNQSIKLEASTLTFMSHKFKLWYSRPVEGQIKSGSFNQDSKGNWYVNLVCEVEQLPHSHPKKEVGIDLGLKTSAALSDGNTISNNREFKKLEQKLAKAQRANKKKQVKNIHRKIANRRKDHLHKETTKIAKTYQTIYVGDVDGRFLQQSNGKSSNDACTGLIRQFLKYKAIRHSGNVVEVSEKFSTVTCSACLSKTGPSGLSDLGVREWTCSNCGSAHDRDINAAQNILRFGHETLRPEFLVKGVS